MNDNEITRMSHQIVADVRAHLGYQGTHEERIGAAGTVKAWLYKLLELEADSQGRPAEDERVNEIRERVSDNFRSIGNDEWRGHYSRDVRYLLSLFPVRPVRCGCEGSCPVCRVGEVDNHRCRSCGSQFCPKCHGLLYTESENVHQCSCNPPAQQIDLSLLPYEIAEELPKIGGEFGKLAAMCRSHVAAFIEKLISERSVQPAAITPHEADYQLSVANRKAQENQEGYAVAPRYPWHPTESDHRPARCKHCGEQIHQVITTWIHENDNVFCIPRQSKCAEPDFNFNQVRPLNADEKQAQILTRELPPAASTPTKRSEWVDDYRRSKQPTMNAPSVCPDCEHEIRFSDNEAGTCEKEIAIGVRCGCHCTLVDTTAASTEAQDERNA